MFLALFFGVGMPILFPMAAIILFNHYVTERIRLAYICKKPPQLGPELSESVISVMKYAPLFMLYNGYWFLDNHQMFFNEYTLIDRINRSMLSTHYFTEFRIS